MVDRLHIAVGIDHPVQGSGRLDHHRSVSEAVIQYGMQLNHICHFDSMHCDIRFTSNGFVLKEMQHTHMDRAIHKASGENELHPSEQLLFRERHTWSQTLPGKCGPQRLSRQKGVVDARVH